MRDIVEVAPLPEEVDFVQSTEQAFYLIEELTIDGELPREDDILIAFNGDALVGSAWWSGEYTPVPVMGKDNNPYTEDYCLVGDKPTFRLLRESTGEMFTLTGQAQGWSSLGVNMLKLSGTTMEIPESFGLGTPYPNPFNPTTAFSYVVGESGMVNVSIYDITGRMVAELASGYQSAGTYDLVWNAGNASSGMYLIKMVVDNHTAMQKIMLIK